jgi:hypothetical protein
LLPYALGLATLSFFSRSSTFNRTFTLLNDGIPTGSGSFSAFCAHSAFSLGAYSEADPTDNHPDTGCRAFLNYPASLRSLDACCGPPHVHQPRAAQQIPRRDSNPSAPAKLLAEMKARGERVGGHGFTSLAQRQLRNGAPKSANV